MTNNQSHEPQLKKYLIASAIAHLAFFLVFSGVFNFTQEEFIIPPSIQVDIVAPPSELPPKNVAGPSKPKPLPQKPKKVEPEKKLPPKEVKAKEEPKGPTVDLEAKKKKAEKKRKAEEKKKKKEAEKKRKADEEKKKKEAEQKEQQRKNDQLQAINKLKQKQALEKLTQQKNEVAEPQVGARLNPGSSFSGLDAIQFNKYYIDLKTHLFNNWSLPQWLAELDLKAQALVVIDESGYVIDKKILKSSGNQNFDDTILSAIDKASPFPMAPERLKNKVKEKEIVFGFPEN